jgi:hypothetical protein
MLYSKDACHKPSVSVGMWLQGDCQRSKTSNAQHLPLKTCTLPQIGHLHFVTSVKHMHFTLLLGHYMLFGGGTLYFHKMKGRGSVSRSHDFNTTDNNLGWTELSLGIN